jgi:hypothetical protein
VVLIVACARYQVTVATPPAYTCYRAPEFAQGAVRRVVLLPTENDTTYAEAAKRFRAGLAAELRATGVFEVVAPPEESLGDCPVRTVAECALPPRLLLEMAMRFNADAVLLSCLTAYHPYSPPRIGATVHLVSTREAATLVSVDGLWDGRNAATAMAARDFVGRLALSDGGRDGDAVLQTPAYFEKLVAWQIAHAFANTPDAGTAAVAPQNLPSAARPGIIARLRRPTMISR